MPDDALAARLLVIFVDELDEQVQQLNDDLLALERTPDDAERLRGVFRVMHTLKGASRAAGLRQIEQVCHTLEHELSSVRDGHATLAGARMALLFEAADALGASRDAMRAGKSLPEDALNTLLQHARAHIQDAAPAASAASGPPRSAPTAPEPLSPAAPPPLPVPTEEPRQPGEPAPRADDAARGGHVRVSLDQVDAIAAAAGEIAGLASQAGDRSTEVAALRAHWRSARTQAGNAEVFVDFDRRLTALLKRASDDARTLGTLSGRLGDSSRMLRQRPFSDVTDNLPRVARDVARELGKDVEVVVAGGEIEADRVVLESLREPLVQLIRNAIDHGIRARGVVRVDATLRGDRLRVAVSDDGPGLDLAAVRRRLEQHGLPVPDDPRALARTIFDDGFTTRDSATAFSGRGVGLGIVRAAAERMGGTVDVVAARSGGTSIVVDVPLSVSTLRAVLVRVGDVMLGIPSAFVLRASRVDPHALVSSDDRTMMLTGDGPVPVTTLAALLGPPFAEAPPSTLLQVLTLESAGQRLAIVVDDVIDERELVLRPVDNTGRSAAHAIVGTALVSSGVLVPVLSVPALAAQSGPRTSFPASLAPRERPRVSRVLVVDDSITSRTLEQSVLAAAGYEVITAVDGLEAWRVLERQEVALVVSDVEMPHLDGFGLCRRIRETERTARLPIILVTSLDEPAQRAMGLEAGADAYITKSSFDQDTLLETVQMLIGRHP